MESSETNPRPTTEALTLAREIRADVIGGIHTPALASKFDQLERLLTNMDARTGRPDPHLRRASARDEFAPEPVTQRERQNEGSLPDPNDR